MIEYRIVKGSIRHVRPMAQHMRVAGSVALREFGFEPRRALHRAFITSSYCRTALIDENPAAMWGCVATLLGESAYVWLVLSESVRTLPRAILFEARRSLRDIAHKYPYVTAVVLPQDEASVRLAKHLGFGGEREGDDPYIDNRYHIPLGDSYAVRLNYRGPA